MLFGALSLAVAGAAVSEARDGRVDSDSPACDEIVLVEVVVWDTDRPLPSRLDFYGEGALTERSVRRLRRRAAVATSRELVVTCDDGGHVDITRALAWYSITREGTEVHAAPEHFSLGARLAGGGDVLLAFQLDALDWDRTSAGHPLREVVRLEDQLEVGGGWFVLDSATAGYAWAGRASEIDLTSGLPNVGRW